MLVEASWGSTPQHPPQHPPHGPSAHRALPSPGRQTPVQVDELGAHAVTRPPERLADGTKTGRESACLPWSRVPARARDGPGDGDGRVTWAAPEMQKPTRRAPGRGRRQSTTSPTIATMAATAAASRSRR
jgi:hypothetical protein